MLLGALSTVVRFIAAVAVPVGGYVVAGWGGAIIAALIARALIEFLLGPAAYLAMQRNGRDHAYELWQHDVQARRDRYRRRLEWSDLIR